MPICDSVTSPFALARQVRHLLKFRQIDRQNRLCGTRSVRTHGRFTRLERLQTERLSLPVIARNRKCALEIVVVVGRTRRGKIEPLSPIKFGMTVDHVMSGLF